jgi:hypothetical protein
MSIFSAIKAQSVALKTKNNDDYVRKNRHLGMPHKIRATWPTCKTIIMYADMYPLLTVAKACRDLNTYNRVARIYDQIIIEGYND